MASITKRIYRKCERAAQRFLTTSAEQGFPLRQSDRRLVRLRNRHLGERVFILGNGPSLKDTDVNRLVGEVSIASNGIFLLFESKDYRPTYYTIEDQLVAEDRRAEANAIAGMTKIFPRDLNGWLDSGRNTIHMNFIRSYPEFPLDGDDDGEDHPRFSTEFEKRAFWGGTVTYLNLQLAYYLGAREVILIGFDHNYAKPKSDDNVKGTVITSQTDDENHFDPRYFGAGYRWHDPKVRRMERAYETALEVFEADGRRVYNATAGGMLDVFPAVDYKSLF